MTDTDHFVFLLLEDFAQLAFANAVEPLRIANLVSGKPLYRWSFASRNGAPVRASNGTTTNADFALSQVPPNARLFVLSGIDAQGHTDKGLLAELRRLKRHGTPIGGLCSGAYVLARAGMLDGQAAAIHWDFHDSFTEAFPDVRLVPNVFVADAPVITASGGSATADLMLHLIADTHGEDLAIAVADQMVYTAMRDGGAEQRVSLQSRSGARNARLAEALKIMRASLEDPLPIAEIAEQVGISTRQLERLFGQHLNTSPKRYLLELRLERARHLLVQTEMSVIDIALACGFENAGHFARVYKTRFGITPMRQRPTLG